MHGRLNIRLLIPCASVFKGLRQETSSRIDRLATFRTAEKATRFGNRARAAGADRGRVSIQIGEFGKNCAGASFAYCVRCARHGLPSSHIARRRQAMALENRSPRLAVLIDADNASAKLVE